MTDRARLERALIAADRAGDTEAARKLAQALRSVPQESAADVPQPAPEPQEAVQEEPVDNRRVGDLGSVIMEPMASMGSSMLAAPVAGLAGIGAAGTRALGLTETEPADVVRGVQGALTYQPRTQAGDVATRAVAYPFEKLAQGADFLGQKASDATGMPSIGAAVNAATQFAPSLLIPALKGRAKPAELPPNVARTAPADAAPVPSQAQPAATNAAAAKRPAGSKGVSEAAPSLEELSKAADAAYKRADEAGIVVKESSLKGLKTRIVSMTKKEGIDSDLHPDSTAALNKIIKSKGNLSLSELETLRKVASDAKGSIKPADRRIADKITEQLDDYIDELADADVVAGDAAKAKALKEARGLYSRKKKAEEINKLVEDAKTSAANFSGSGLENALRTEFRKLAKNEKRMRRFTKEEQAAIKKVATGGSPASLNNVMRFIGKFAPTGVVSGVLSGGAGAMIGGPLGAALPLAGLAGRAVATRMTTRNANAAGELMRRGRSLESEKKRNKLAEPLTY